MSFNHVTLYVKPGQEASLESTHSFVHKGQLKIKTGEKKAKQIKKGGGDDTLTIDKVIRAGFDKIKGVGSKKERLKFDIFGENSSFDLAIKILPKDAAQKAREGKLNLWTSFFWAPITIEDGAGNKQTFLVNRSSAEKRLSELGFTKEEVKAWLKTGKLDDSFFDELLTKDLEKKIHVKFSGKYSVMNSEDQAKLIKKLESLVKSGEILEEEIDALLRHVSFRTEEGECIGSYLPYDRYDVVPIPIYQQINYYDDDNLEKAKDYLHFSVALKNKEKEWKLNDRSFLDKERYDNNGRAFLDIRSIKKENGNETLQNAFPREKQIQQFEEALEIYIKEQEQFKEETESNPTKKNQQLFLDLYKEKKANKFTDYSEGLKIYTEEANEMAAIKKANKQKEILKQKAAGLASIDEILKDAPLGIIQEVVKFCNSRRGYAWNEYLKEENR